MPTHGRAHLGIVIDDNGHRPAVLDEPAQESGLGHPGRPAVSVPPHDQLALGEPVPGEPCLGVRPGALGSPGEVDQHMVGGEPARDGDTLGEWRIGRDAGEERDPVAVGPVEMVQPVPDIGDDTVEVDDGDGSGLGHDRTLSPGRPKAS